MLQYGNLHSKIIESHNSKQTKSGYWLPASTFEGRIDMVNSYN